MTVFVYCYLKKTCVRPLSERETYRRFTLVVFLYWRKSYNCSDVLALLMCIEKTFLSHSPLSDFVFLYWRKSYNCSEVLSFCNKCQLRKDVIQRKHVVALRSFFVFVSLLKENLSNKKGKNGKKREKSHFHVFSIKQRCFAEFLVYIFPFSLFPPKK